MPEIVPPVPTQQQNVILPSVCSQISAPFVRGQQSIERDYLAYQEFGVSVANLLETEYDLGSVGSTSVGQNNNFSSYCS
jgi:hypothetical protein